MSDTAEMALLESIPDGLFIGGEWRPARGGGTHKVLDPGHRLGSQDHRRRRRGGRSGSAGRSRRRRSGLGAYASARTQ